MPRRISFSPLVDKCFSAWESKKLPDVLYHYTSGPTFIEIIQSKQLWLTHFACVNDTTEVAHGIKKLSEFLAKRISRSKNKKLLPLYNYLRGLPADVFFIPPIYIGCFTKTADDLSQWRAYGTPAGYALGFSSEIMKRTSAELGFRIAPVIYSESSKLREIRTLVVGLEKSYLHMCSTMTVDAEQLDELVTAWLRDICAILVFMKNNSFRDEKEYRITCSPGASSILYRDSVLRFKYRGLMLTQHLPFHIYSVGKKATRKMRKKEVKLPLMLTNVRVGPIPGNEEFARRSAKQFLESNGHNGFSAEAKKRGEPYVDVGSSRIPYRTF